jgi:hypothetical protein
MFHMLTCFNLKPSATVAEFGSKLTEFSAYMQELGLLESTGPIGHRQRHPVMDTDDERDHEYFFVMSFRDRAQCDRAVEQVQSAEQPGDTIHRSVYAEICDPVFICWEDI